MVTGESDAGRDASSTTTTTWSKTTLTGANIVSAIAVDPKNPKIVFAGVAAGSAAGGYFRTKDGGKTWTKIAGGLPDRFAGSLAVSTRDGTILANPGVEGIWRSVDGGETFVRAATDPGGTNGLLFHPTTNVAWAVSSQQGCFRSSDGGKSWARTPNTGLPLNQFPLGPMSHDGAKLYLGTGGKGIYVSTDDGTTWTKAASTTLPDSAAGGDVLNLVSRPGALFVQTTHAGIFRSTDGGVTFTKLDTGGQGSRYPALAFDPMNAQAVYVSANEGQGGPGGLFKTTNSGQSWSAIGPNTVPVASVAVGSDGTVYIGTTGQGVWRIGGAP